MAEVVLDASALLALLNREPGAESVAAVLPGAALSTLNLAEVVAKLSDGGMPGEAVREVLQGLPVEVMPFDEEHAYKAGLLPRSAGGAALSLGDRGCLSLAQSLGLPVLTADRSWRHLSVGVEVRLIR
ncbi:MAG: type II toxin-antitoxin system VapC family toxin [Chloroflexota bacterium]